MGKWRLLLAIRIDHIIFDYYCAIFQCLHFLDVRLFFKLPSTVNKILWLWKICEFFRFFCQHWLIAPFKWKPVRKFVEFITIIHLRREIYIIKGNKCWFRLINVYSLFHFRLASTWAVGCTFRQEASVYVIKCCYYVTEIATM